MLKQGKRQIVCRSQGEMKLKMTPRNFRALYPSSFTPGPSCHSLTKPVKQDLPSSLPQPELTGVSRFNTCIHLLPHPAERFTSRRYRKKCWVWMRVQRGAEGLLLLVFHQVAFCKRTFHSRFCKYWAAPVVYGGMVSGPGIQQGTSWPGGLFSKGRVREQTNA